MLSELAPSALPSCLQLPGMQRGGGAADSGDRARGKHHCIAALRRGIRATATAAGARDDKASEKGAAESVRMDQLV